MAEPAITRLNGECFSASLSEKSKKLAEEFEINLEELALHSQGESLEVALMTRVKQISSEIIAEQNAYIEKHGIPFEEFSVRFDEAV